MKIDKLKWKSFIINTKYKNYGGEDSNFEKKKIFKKFYEVDYLNFDNSKNLNIYDVIVFTLSNPLSNKVLKVKLKTFKPDIVYIHNTWFK